MLDPPGVTDACAVLHPLKVAARHGVVLDLPRAAARHIDPPDVAPYSRAGSA